VSNPDDGEYTLWFMHPITFTRNGTESISASASKEEFKAAVEPYYEWAFDAEIWVEKKDFKADGTETEVPEEVDHVQYEITLKKLIHGETVGGISVVAISTISEITVELPSEV